MAWIRAGMLKRIEGLVINRSFSSLLGRENYIICYETIMFYKKERRGKKMKVINLTPHNVNICDENGKVIKTYRASGTVARHYVDQTDEILIESND